MKKKTKTEQRERRKKRIRAKISGTAEKPRLSIFKSNKYITLQIINDNEGRTICFSTSKDRKEKTNTLRAEATGLEIAEIAKKLGLKEVVFDRNGYIYTGSVAAAAEGARKGGLKF